MALQNATVDVSQADRAERIAIERYTEHGHILPHHDVYWGSDSLEFGRRFLTLTIYLETPKVGGASIFPDVAVKVEAEPGDALLWHNLYTNGVPDDYVRHGECPVINGNKTMLIYFIRSFYQEFKARCRYNAIRHRLIA